MINKIKKELAKNEKDWWDLMRRDLNKWNQSSHEEDNMGLNEWVGEYIGRVIYGWKVTQIYGEINLIKSN
jgi:hypothetical protein